MKKTFLFMLLLVGLWAGLSAQTEEATNMLAADEFIEEEIKGIEWKTDKFFRIGEIPQDKPVTVTFEFVNTADEPIVITLVKSSCSCSVSEYTKEPIPKGGKGVINATYDAKEEGAFFKTFMLLTNRSTTPNVLFIEGSTIPNNK